MNEPKTNGMAVAQPDETNAGGTRCTTIEELFTALESPLLAYARRWLRDPDSAEDVVQEAFMKLHAQFDQVSDQRSWLYRTVHNLAVNHLRQTSKIVPLDRSAPGSENPAAEVADPDLLPDEQIVRLEGIGLVRLSINALDERSRQLIALKFNENLSYKDISARTGLTVSHVGYLLHHALKSIAAELAKTGLAR